MAYENTSPWLRQVRRTRPVFALSEDANSDVAIVGGGISGVVTAYFLLRDTNLSVMLTVPSGKLRSTARRISRSWKNTIPESRTST